MSRLGNKVLSNFIAHEVLCDYVLFSKAFDQALIRISTWFWILTESASLTCLLNFRGISPIKNEKHSCVISSAVDYIYTHGFYFIGSCALIKIYRIRGVHLLLVVSAEQNALSPVLSLSLPLHIL